MSGYLAGIFLADDDVIVDVIQNKNSADIAFNKTPPHRERSTGDLAEDLCLALKAIEKLLPPNSHIETVALAMPGPIRGSGTVTELGKDIISTTYHRRGQKWRDISVDTEFEKAHQKSGTSALFTDESTIVVYPDSAAYALGDYYLARAREMAKAGDEQARANAESEFARNTVFAHVTVDEGIGGAVVINRELVPGRIHAELGHIPVRRHEDETIEPKCPAHRFAGCLESYAALPALRERWGEDVAQDLRSWTAEDKRLKLIAYYIAQLCAVIVLIVSPTRISFSGRVMRNQALIDLVGYYTQLVLEIPNYGGIMYPGYPATESADFVGRRHDVNAGIYGCIVLAAKPTSRIADMPRIIGGTDHEKSSL